MNAMDEALSLMKELESIQDLDPFREKTTRIAEILKAALGRPHEAEKALYVVAAGGLLIGEPPRLVFETDVRESLWREGLLAREALVGGGQVYEMTVQGDHFVKRVLTELYVANRSGAVTS